ncbi:putative 2-alkenal reductase [Gammaproteobacteria bacterium]
MSSNRFVNIGIDHGTSNSAIAVMEASGVWVIGPTPTERVMPSFVYFTKRGTKYVGKTARESLLTLPETEGSGIGEYKPDIGRNIEYKFSASGKTLTGPELGGLVIGELLDLCQRETGERPKSAIITRPAMFDQAAVEGTRRAAELAGLHHFELLQEPVAAALAYGFNASDERAQWMVFDLGGGTLDVSLVVVRKGEMRVLEDGHAGDNYLGGRNFDHTLYEYIMEQLSKEYPMEQFQRSDRFSQDRGRLRLRIEDLKIKLSTQRRAKLEIDLACDDNGETVPVDMEITRETYEQLITPDVARAAQVCETLLERQKLRNEQIDSVILVGGPTKTPYIRKVLSERLGIPLLDRIDPMTAVAQGAAIYAATIPHPDNENNHANKKMGQITLKLQADAHSSISTYHLMGAVEGEDISMAELSVEIERDDKLWSSGRLSLDERGLFEADLLLVDKGKPFLSTFTTNVYDNEGKILAHEEGPRIWYPYVTPPKNQQPTSLRIGTADGSATILIQRGAALPAHGRRRFKTTKQLRKGDNDDVLWIPAVASVLNIVGEEENTLNCAVPVGTLIIKGDDRRVTRDLPAGTEVDVQLESDGSQKITISAYVQLLGEDFDAEFTKTDALPSSIDELTYQLKEITNELKVIRDIQTRKRNLEVERVLSKLNEQEAEQSIARDLHRAQQIEGGERIGNQWRAQQHLAEMKGTILYLQRVQKTKRTEILMENLGRIIDLLEKSKDPEVMMNARRHKNRLAIIHREYLTIGSNHEQLEKELQELDNEIRVCPYEQLMLRILAAGGHEGPVAQVTLVHDANEFLDSMEAKGGVEMLAKEDVVQISQYIKRIDKIIPDMHQWIEDCMFSGPCKDRLASKKTGKSPSIVLS